MGRRFAKLLVGFAILAGALLSLAVILTLSRPIPPTPPLPNPNGYDDFLKASRLITDPPDYAKLTVPELRQALAKHEETLRLIKTGLSRDCRVPLYYSSTNFQAHINDITDIRRLAQLLVAEGRLAEAENRFGEAAEYYLLTIRLGQASSRGGLMIHKLVGVAIEAIGLGPAEKLIPKLDAKQCREFAAALETADLDEESLQAIVDRDRAWGRRTYGWKTELTYLLSHKISQRTIQTFNNRARTTQARVRQLTLSLAARAYELEKGQPPKSPDDVVPAYLKTVPQDPVTGTNLKYF
jgi:hypothetical protein